MVSFVDGLTSSYVAISSSTTGAVTGAGASVATGTGGATLALVVEPGLGGREGCRGELEGRGVVKVDGVGSGRATGLSTLMIELTSGVTTMVGGAGGFAAVALALASAESLSSLFFRSAIFPSSNLIFFTKSLTSPGLGIQV